MQIPWRLFVFLFNEFIMRMFIFFMAVLFFPWFIYLFLILLFQAIMKKIIVSKDFEVENGVLGLERDIYLSIVKFIDSSILRKV
jgi:hypothetical protein